ncbi:Alpha/Beta hydrolase protein [Aspergillus coremiiformis]|uniref:Alpha/Beta hydrolase protein n=1 Tax=Aspergillus coremiiformis TaxID=138285 RepID=A0A5N6ZHI1_9EURO|nr:Alpha/Beta hydrolase protein [Aspergillus coremiiformis]
MKMHSLLPLVAFTPTRASTVNDFACKLTTEHPNPLVLLHGLGATSDEDLNFLQSWLQSQGYCTYAQTYGAYDGFPLLGGLRPIIDSSAEIAAYLRTVAEHTGAPKIDLVGHSEGAFQSLYVPKFQGVSDLLDKVVAIAPPTRGTDFGGLYRLADAFGQASRDAGGNVLRTFGCPACDELTPGGAAVARLNDGQPIVQKGNTLTVIVSRGDEMVTPHETSWVREDGVNNIYVQDFCPLDPVGHIGEAYDLNVWNLVKNALDGTPEKKFFCVLGSPGKI